MRIGNVRFRRLGSDPLVSIPDVPFGRGPENEMVLVLVVDVVVDVVVGESWLA